MNDLAERFHHILERVEVLTGKLNIEENQRKISALEQEVNNPDFWNDQQKAQQKMQLLNQLKEEVQNLDSLSTLATEGLETIKLFADELGDEDKKTLEQDLVKSEKLLQKMELQAYLSSPYDQSSAIFSIHAGQGGTEACDWAAMLQRMYIRYFEKKGWKYTLVNERPGDEAGIKSATYFVEQRLAYGYLKGEHGTHRLVRLSPFNADNLRQTSFAGIEVLPLLDETADITIKDEDIEFDAFRSGGHGGQNVNKVSTAVRIKHIPSGIVVECQTQRSQEQNRKIAMQLLKAKLWEIEEAKRQKELVSIKGEHKVHGWGNQIRSYVLHPYQLVKDNRTNVETSATDTVLGGELDEFIQAEIRL